MRLFDFLSYLFNSNFEKPVKINVKELELILKTLERTTNAINLTPLRIKTMDLEYNLYSKEEVKSFLSKDLFNLKKTSKEFDCDDFSLIMLGRLREKFRVSAIGLAISVGHVYILFIDKNKQLYAIEPQTDQLISLSDFKKNKMYYPVSMIII